MDFKERTTHQQESLFEKKTDEVLLDSTQKVDLMSEAIEQSKTEKSVDVLEAEQRFESVIGKMNLRKPVELGNPKDYEDTLKDVTVKSMESMNMSELSQWAYANLRVKGDNSNFTAIVNGLNDVLRIAVELKNSEKISKKDSDAAKAVFDNLRKECFTYSKTHNPWFSNGKKRMKLVQMLAEGFHSRLDELEESLSFMKYEKDKPELVEKAQKVREKNKDIDSDDDDDDDYEDNFTMHSDEEVREALFSEVVGNLETERKKSKYQQTKDNELIGDSIEIKVEDFEENTEEYESGEYVRVEKSESEIKAEEERYYKQQKAILDRTGLDDLRGSDIHRLSEWATASMIVDGSNSNFDKIAVTFSDLLYVVDSITANKDKIYKLEKEIEAERGLLGGESADKIEELEDMKKEIEEQISIDTVRGKEINADLKEMCEEYCETHNPTFSSGKKRKYIAEYIVRWNNLYF